MDFFLFFDSLQNHPPRMKRQQSLLSEDEEFTTGSEVTEDELSKKQASKKTIQSHRLLKKQLSFPNLQRKEKAAKLAPREPLPLPKAVAPEQRESQNRVNTPFTMSIQKSKWDNSRSILNNQDAQREEDQRRMGEIVGYLTKMRFGDHEKWNSKDTKKPAGGVCASMEAPFRSSSQATKNKKKAPRPKIRPAPIRTTKRPQKDEVTKLVLKINL